MTENEIKQDSKNRTYLNSRYISKMRNKLKIYDEDREKLLRQGEHLCKFCYYIDTDRIAGQAFWTNNCHSCGKEMTFPTTDTNDFCESCANKLDVCKHCGQELD